MTRQEAYDLILAIRSRAVALRKISVAADEQLASIDARIIDRLIEETFDRFDAEVELLSVLRGKWWAALTGQTKVAP